MRMFLSTVQRPEIQLLWEPRGEWPSSLIVDLCCEHQLVHVVDPMQRDTLTPDQTHFRLHGTTGSRRVHTDVELHRLRELVRGRRCAYVLFNNLPRAGDAERFIHTL